MRALGYNRFKRASVTFSGPRVTSNISYNSFPGTQLGPLSHPRFMSPRSLALASARPLFHLLAGFETVITLLSHQTRGCFRACRKPDDGGRRTAGLFGTAEEAGKGVVPRFCCAEKSWLRGKETQLVIRFFSSPELGGL